MVRKKFKKWKIFQEVQHITNIGFRKSENIKQKIIKEIIKNKLHVIDYQS